MSFEISKEESTVEIISIQNVKPSIATPQHLKNYNLSFLDQFNRHIYASMVHFYLNSDPSYDFDEDQEAGARLWPARREVLKKSLSRTLSQLYPLAGEPSHDGLCIESNDNGVYYVEARVRERLSDFLTQPTHNDLCRFLPFHPQSPELAGQTHMVLVQVNIFNCGGIALGVFASHKLTDGQTHITFLKAWAGHAREEECSSTEKILPDLNSAPSVFVQDPTLMLEKEMHGRSNRAETKKQRSIKSTRRFVFHASDLAALKAKTGARSRVVAVIGLIWKCVISGNSHKRLENENHSLKPSCLLLPINLRPRLHISPYSIGNVYWFAHAHLSPDVAADGLEFGTVMGSLGKCIGEILSEDFVNGNMSKEELWRNIVRCECDEGDSFVATGACNGGIYEADFGFGEQIWSIFVGINDDYPTPRRNLIVLTDTRSGGGIEALVTLDEENMKILEKDEEILGFATLDPSPLQIHNLPPRTPAC